LQISGVAAADATPAGTGFDCVVSGTCNPPTTSTRVGLTVSLTADATITADTTVCPNSTGNAASVPDAGVGATYSWTITGSAGASGTITAGQGTRTITYTAGSASGNIQINVTVINAAGCTGSSSKPVTIAAVDANLQGWRTLGAGAPLWDETTMNA